MPDVGPTELSPDVRGGQYTLVLAGEVDMLFTPKLEDAVRRLCEDGANELVLDLREVTFIDSTGLKAMLLVSELCREHDCTLSLVPGPRRVQSLFEMTGVAKLLRFQSDGEPARLAQDAILPKLFTPDSAHGDDGT